MATPWGDAERWTGGGQGMGLPPNARCVGWLPHHVLLLSARGPAPVR
ncbi:hypothetical protein OHA72_28735 [Dactylosporangium sp. NBC_01737]|nr:hypothetical protein OHA72_28735 [Dactylosporangium sp. NBC_01737]